jgi:hypothetical protein
LDPGGDSGEFYRFWVITIFECHDKNRIFSVSPWASLDDMREVSFFIKLQEKASVQELVGVEVAADVPNPTHGVDEVLGRDGDDGEENPHNKESSLDWTSGPVHVDDDGLQLTLRAEFAHRCFSFLRVTNKGVARRCSALAIGI